MLPYPKIDEERIDRIREEVIGFMRQDDSDEELVARVDRWISYTCKAAERRGPFPFQSRVASTTLAANADIIDILGQVSKIGNVYCPTKLTKIPLSAMIETRQQAIADNRPNAGEPKFYAIEGSRRFHLWPAPASQETFAFTFTAPILPAIVPNDWEAILVAGTLGLFGAQMDLEKMIRSPGDFKRDFYQWLRESRADNIDIEWVDRWSDPHAAAVGSVTPNSSTGVAVETCAPASLTGIGYVTIETGCYPLEVA